jgi:hypothetical protein
LITPWVGYVQGMSFIAAIMMTYTTPNDAFLMLTSLIQNMGMKEIYRMGFPGLNEAFHVQQQMTAKYMPKLAQKFEDECVIP